MSNLFLGGRGPFLVWIFWGRKGFAAFGHKIEGSHSVFFLTPSLIRSSYEERKH